MNLATSSVDGPKLKRVRIFISSPGDVGPERALANATIRRLQKELVGRLTLETYLWELEALRAGADFQSQIPATGDFDIVVGLFWTRLGTALAEQVERRRLPGPVTGTQLELEQALESAQTKGQPNVLLYRKTQVPQYQDPDPEVTMRKCRERSELEAYWHELVGGGGEAFRRAFHTFESSEKFAVLFETHLRKLLHEYDPERRPSSSWKTCPYRGLDSFKAEHAAVFYGRRAESLDVVEQLRQRASAGLSFLLVSGASGTGKSSLVRAGVRPLLTSPGVVDGVTKWRVAIFKPSDQGYDLPAGIARSLCARNALPELLQGGRSLDDLIHDLRSRPQSLVSEIRGSLRSVAMRCEREDPGKDANPNLLWVVDQMEEVLAKEVKEYGQVLGEALATLCEAKRYRVWVLATVRSDLLHKLQEIPALRRLSSAQGSYVLYPPTRAALHEMIRQPALAAGVTFEEKGGRSLDQAIFNDASQETRVLPLLQFTLQQLWERDVESPHSEAPQGGPRQAPVLRFGTYYGLGGSQGVQGHTSPIVGALTAHADSVLEDVRETDSEAWEALDRVLQRLVRVRAGETVRVPLSVDTLDEMGSAARRLAEALVRGRLLIADQGAVQLTHEALTRRWKYLTELVARRREFLGKRLRVRRSSEAWHQARKDEEPQYQQRLLAAGLPLEEGRSLLEEASEDIDADIREFVHESIQTDETKQAERERQRLARESEKLAHERQRVHAARRFNVVVVLMLAAATMGYWVAARAESHAKWELQKRTLTNALAESDALVRRQLLLELEDDFEDSDLRRAFVEAVAEPVPRSELVHLGGGVRHVLASPDGDYLAAAWSDGRWCVVELDSKGCTVSDPVWNSAEGDLSMGSLQWAPGGERLWLHLDNGASEAWRLNDEGTLSRDSQRPPGPVSGNMTFAERVVESLLASPGVSSTLRGTIEGSWPEKDYSQAVWSPDGKHLGLAGGFGPPHVLNTKTDEFLDLGSTGWGKSAEEPSQWIVEELGFDPSGNKLAFLTKSNELHWGPPDGSESWQSSRLQIAGYGAEAGRVEFAQWAWYGDRPEFVALESGSSARMMPQESRSFSLIRPLAPRVSVCDEPRLRCIATDQSGHRLVTGAEGGEVQLWSLAEPALLARFSAHPGHVEDVAMDPDGRWWASAGEDGRVRVWATRLAENPVARIDPMRWNGAAVDTLDLPVPTLTFGPHGHWLTMARWTGAAQLWRIDAEKSQPTFEAIKSFQPARVRHARFSFDGSWLTCLRVRDDHTGFWHLELWHLGMGHAVRRVPLPELADNPTAVEFSRDGQAIWVATSQGLSSCDLDSAAGRSSASWVPSSPSLALNATASRWHLGPDANAAAAHLEDGELLFWRLPPGADEPDRHHRVSGPSSKVAIRFDRSGSQALVVDADNTPVVIDLAGDQDAVELGEGAVKTWAKGSGYPAFEPMAALSDDGSLVALAYKDRSVAWWQLRPGKEPERVGANYMPGIRHNQDITELRFHPSGAWLASTDAEGRTLLWDTANQQGPIQFQPEPMSYVQGRLSFSPTEPWLAEANSLGPLRIWSYDINWAREYVANSVTSHRSQPSSSP